MAKADSGQSRNADKGQTAFTAKRAEVVRQKELLADSAQKVGHRPNAGQTKFDQETAAKTGRSERAVRVEVVKQKKELKAKLAHNSEPYRPSEGQSPARGIMVGTRP